LGLGLFGVVPTVGEEEQRSSEVGPAMRNAHALCTSLSQLMTFGPGLRRKGVRCWRERKEDVHACKCWRSDRRSRTSRW
jgi:hypothetical protein